MKDLFWGRCIIIKKLPLHRKHALSDRQWEQFCHVDRAQYEPEEISNSRLEAEDGSRINLN